MCHAKWHITLTPSCKFNDVRTKQSVGWEERRKGRETGKRRWKEKDNVLLSNRMQQSSFPRRKICWASTQMLCVHYASFNKIQNINEIQEINLESTVANLRVIQIMCTQPQESRAIKVNSLCLHEHFPPAKVVLTLVTACVHSITSWAQATQEMYQAKFSNWWLPNFELFPDQSATPLVQSICLRLLRWQIWNEIMHMINNEQKRSKRLILAIFTLTSRIENC